MVLPVGQGIRLGARVAEDEIPREHPAHVLVLADGHLLPAIDIRFAALHHPLANIYTRIQAVSAHLAAQENEVGAVDPLVKINCFGIWIGVFQEG